MKRVCIGVYFSANLPELRQTMVQLRANTPRSVAVLLLADAPDAVTSLELRAFPDLLQLPTTVHHGPAGCFHQFVHASDADICVFIQSGTLVSPDWLAEMLYGLNRDSSIGIVVAGENHNENTILLVRREVARTIDVAESERADAARWVSGYCQRAKRAGFETLTTALDTQQVRLPMTARHARGPNAHQRNPDIEMPDLRMPAVPRPVNRPSWPAASRTQHYRESRNEARFELGGVSVVGHFNIATGYGSMSEYLVRGMSRAGAHVNIVPLTVNWDGLSDEFTDLLRRSRKLASDPVLFYSWPEPNLQPILSRSETFLYTMWESSCLPNGWAEQINQARAVIVPSRFVARMFRENGVTSPIEVVPDGVDPDIYKLIHRPETAGLTTLTVGPIDNRKNVRKGIAAWKQAFADDPDARLIIKTQYNYRNYTPDDPRIRYVDVVENSRGISHWYQQADVLLALGSEGFGLPLIEAMATGLPVIALNSEGQADMCEDAPDLLLQVAPDSWEIYHSGFGSLGLHGVPSVSEVAGRLRWVATHRAEARELGRAASQWVLRNRDVWTKGPAVLDVIERYTHSSRPLRRATVMWTPSWQSPCGIAEYTAYLHECLPSSVKVTAHQPDLRTLRLLHIQHHTGIFSESHLAACVGYARQAGVPVVVTEHAVDDKARAWERDASVIICPHSLGASKIAARWPRKRVDHIAHGCPAWFPPRKAIQAKVIGAFGFLADYKGFWQLLQVLREIPGTELLLFSHAKSAEIEARWEKAATGLPVRRIREYLQAHEIAERLAAEADVLAFWYDDISSYSPSGAVRIGLATGVPVLASPTQWFCDLGDVTYQPTSLVEGLRRLLEDTELRSSLTNRARDYCSENSWSKVAERHVELWRTLT